MDGKSKNCFICFEFNVKSSSLGCHQKQSPTAKRFKNITINWEQSNYGLKMKRRTKWAGKWIIAMYFLR